MEHFDHYVLSPVQAKKVFLGRDLHLLLTNNFYNTKIFEAFKKRRNDSKCKDDNNRNYGNR